MSTNQNTWEHQSPRNDAADRQQIEENADRPSRPSPHAHFTPSSHSRSSNSQPSSSLGDRSRPSASAGSRQLGSASHASGPPPFNGSPYTPSSRRWASESQALPGLGSPGLQGPSQSQPRRSSDYMMHSPTQAVESFKSVQQRVAQRLGPEMVEMLRRLNADVDSSYLPLHELADSPGHSRPAYTGRPVDFHENPVYRPPQLRQRTTTPPGSNNTTGLPSADDPRPDQRHASMDMASGLGESALNSTRQRSAAERFEMPYGVANPDRSISAEKSLHVDNQPSTYSKVEPNSVSKAQMDHLRGLSSPPGQYDQHHNAPASLQITTSPARSDQTSRNAILPPRFPLSQHAGMTPGIPRPADLSRAPSTGVPERNTIVHVSTSTEPPHSSEARSVASAESDRIASNGGMSDEALNFALAHDVGKEMGAQYSSSELTDAQPVIVNDDQSDSQTIPSSSGADHEEPAAPVANDTTTATTSQAPPNDDASPQRLSTANNPGTRISPARPTRLRRPSGNAPEWPWHEQGRYTRAPLDFNGTDEQYWDQEGRKRDEEKRRMNPPPPPLHKNTKWSDIAKR